MSDPSANLKTYYPWKGKRYHKPMFTTTQDWEALREIAKLLMAILEKGRNQNAERTHGEKRRNST
jgi:hypothetical protein